MWAWLLVPLGYLAGSIQWGLLVVRLSKRMDVRSIGSGKTGVTNVLRASGKKAAALVLLLDAGKGFALTMAARSASGDSWLHAAVAAAVIVGHIWPVFAGFRGGRGIATGLGCTLALFPLASAAGLAVFVPVVARTRFVSLGSVLGVAAVVIVLVAAGLLGNIPLPYAAFGVSCGTLVVWMHRDNIARLLNGTERKLGEPAARLPGAP